MFLSQNHNFTDMKAMLFAAGLGTRLKPFTNTAPKALARVAGKSLLEHSINYLKLYGISDIVINVHHFAEQILNELGGNGNFGATVQISDECNEILETGGGLLKALPHFKDENCFLAMNVDVVTNINLTKLIDAHRQSGGLTTLAVMQRPSSRQLLFNNGILCGWQNTATGEERISRIADGYTPMAFSGIQVVSPALFLNCPFGGKFSLIDLYLHAAKKQNIFAFDHTGDLFIDVGKPETLAQAEVYLSGRA